MFTVTKRILTLALSGAALLLAVTTAPVRAQAPDEPERPRFRIGPEVGLFLPTDEKTRDRFGGSWVSFGLGLGAVPRAEAKGRLGFNFNVLYKSRGDNRALIAPIGVRFRQGFNADPNASFSPYAGASADIYAVDIRSPQDNVRSGFRAAPGGSVFLGFSAAESGFLEARYLVISRVRGFDLSGFNIVGGYRF